MMTHKDFFFKVLDLLDANGIEYWLMCGTLLSAVRDGDFLKTDTSDTDIAIKDEDYWKVRKLFNEEHLAGRMTHNFIRRKELTINDLEYKYKVDVFAMDRDDQDYFLYSYEKNPETGRWDKEWRVKYPHNLFFPLKQTEFLGRKVNIPNKTEEILKIHYGEDWRTPNSNWDGTKPPHRDYSYKGFAPAGWYPKDLPINNEPKKLAFICVNFLRKGATKNAIESLQANYKDIQIYIADQDEPSTEMVEFYEKHGVKYYYLPYDCGLSYCRNYLISQVEEPYIMWGDNDFIFDENNHIEDALELLDSDDKIGVVGGSTLKNNVMQHYERMLMYDKEHGILVYVPLEMTDPTEHTFKDLPYYYCDLTFNHAIAKREVFKNKRVRWNPNLKVRYEHSDFFLRLKQFSKYKVVYFPAFTVHHMHVGSKAYQDMRCRAKDGEDFAKSWKLRMNFTIGKGKETYGESVESVEKLQTTKPVTEMKFSANPEKVLRSFADTLIGIGKDFYLLEKTCLEAVKYHELHSNELYIGVDLTEEEKYQISKRGFEWVSNKTFKFQDVYIHIRNFVPENSKDVNIQDDIYQIPLPVVYYLKKLYGENWKEI